MPVTAPLPPPPMPSVVPTPGSPGIPAGAAGYPVGYPAPHPAMDPITLARELPAVRWPLILSPGARKLVVAFFVIGAAGFALYLVAIPTFLGVTRTTQQADDAGQQAVQAYNGLRQSVAAFSLQSARCRADQDPTATTTCLESNDAMFATALDLYATNLGTIGAPTSVGPEVLAAQAAARQAGGTLRQLSQAGPDPSAYLAAVEQSSIQAQLQDVDTTYNETIAALSRLAQGP